jgi:hypothetical protein
VTRFRLLPPHIAVTGCTLFAAVMLAACAGTGIRTTARTCGHISLTKHFEAWKSSSRQAAAAAGLISRRQA